MKPLRCDFCGGQLVMDESREFAVCEFCDTKYMKETVQQKIQEICGQVSITRAVETVTGSAEKERLLKNAETYIEIKEFEKAAQTYSLIIKNYPEDYRGWWGSFTTRCEAYLYNKTLVYSEPNALINSRRLSHNQSIIDEYLNKLPLFYGNKLHLIKNDSLNYFSFNKIPSPPIIDKFSEWLIYDIGANTHFLTHNINKFIIGITHQFAEGIFSGNIFLPSKYNKPPLYQYSWEVNTASMNQEKTIALIAKREKLTYYVIPKPKTYPPEVLEYKLLNSSASLSYKKLLKIIGSWVIVEDFNNAPVSVLLSNRFYQQDIYKHLKLCQHCCGTLSGFLNPICQKCGKPKDY